MDPNGNQFSIDNPCNDNTARWHRPPLPRSFKHPSHGERAYWPSYGLLIAHLGPNSSSHEKRRYGPFWGFSWCPLRFSKKLLLGLSRVWANSRARILSIIRGDQTRLCRARCLSRSVSLCIVEALIRLTEVTSLQLGSKANFLFVSQRETKMECKMLVSGKSLLT